MKAAYFQEPGRLGVEELDVHAIGDDEILVRIGAACICGTDLRIFKNGHFKIPQGSRRVLGHELSGKIVKVGKLVKGYAEGARVSITPNIGCGTCEFCRAGFNQMCPDYEAFGISLDGGFQEYLRVPSIAIRAGNIFPIPDHVSYEEAALTEPLSCTFSALNGLNVGFEDTVLVIGAGPIGACFVMLSKVRGAKRVIVAERRPERLAEIAKFGADILINSEETDLKSEINRITQGRGVDVVLTAASVPALQSLAVELLATHGRVNFFGGLPKNEPNPIDTNRMHYKGLKAMGTTGSSNLDYYRSMQLVADGRVNLKALVSRTFEISEITPAFNYALSGEGLKTMVVNP